MCEENDGPTGIPSALAPHDGGWWRVFTVRSALPLLWRITMGPRYGNTLATQQVEGDQQEGAEAEKDEEDYDKKKKGKRESIFSR